jgi:hypothetical protein
MIIDKLKPFLNQIKPENTDFNPIKSVVETFFRTVITFDGKALVIESDENFTLELVDNTKNSWKTLEFHTFYTKKDLFLAIERIILDQYKQNKPTIKESDLSTKQKVLLRQERILKCIENKPFITIPEIVELLKSDYQEISRSIAILKNKNKITEHRNDLQKSYQLN